MKNVQQAHTMKTLKRFQLRALLLFISGLSTLMYANAQVLTEERLRDELLNVDEGLIEQYQDQVNEVLEQGSSEQEEAATEQVKVDSMLSGESKEPTETQEKIVVPANTGGPWVDKIHGMNLFYNNSIPVYQSTSPRSAPADYVLDVGDTTSLATCISKLSKLCGWNI